MPLCRGLRFRAGRWLSWVNSRAFRCHAATQVYRGGLMWAKGAPDHSGVALEIVTKAGESRSASARTCTTGGSGRPSTGRSAGCGRIPICCLRHVRHRLAVQGHRMGPHRIRRALDDMQISIVHETRGSRAFGPPGAALPDVRQVYGTLGLNRKWNRVQFDCTRMVQATAPDGFAVADHGAGNTEVECPFSGSGINDINGLCAKMSELKKGGAGSNRTIPIATSCLGACTCPGRCASRTWCAPSPRSRAGPG